MAGKNFPIPGRQLTLPQFVKLLLKVLMLKITDLYLSLLVFLKYLKKLICDRFMKFLEANNFLPNFQFAYRKGLGACDALLSLVSPIQAALDNGSEACAICLDFSSAFDRINHSGLIFKLQSIGVGGSFFKYY